ncbi:MAG: Hemin transport system permease protein HmuU [Burkholderia plantarii]|nr:MAG: Hemin transport system permease protein HmuU [Burkholderia plantarii]
MAGTPTIAGPRTGTHPAAGPHGDTVARRRRVARVVLAALTIAVPLAMLAACCIGAYPITPQQLLAILRSPDDAALQQARAVLIDIRAPRVVLAALVGIGFGTAGAAMLIVLGPLLAATPVPVGALPIAAFGGALAVAALVYRLAATRGRLALPLLLLAGIAINALAGAAIGLLTYVASDAQLRSLTFWSLGSVGGAQWSTIGAVAPFALAGCAWLARQRHALNALQLGEMEALHLGVPVQRVKRGVLIATALGIGALVSCTGVIGFIGLVAPHCVRLVCGPDQRIVMPGAALIGALLTVLADLAARTVAAPTEIPLGILTALIGAPFFLILLRKRRGALGG